MGALDVDARWLAMALGEAAKVAACAKELRQLRWQAMEVSRAAMGPCAPKGTEHSGIDDLDLVLAEVRAAVGSHLDVPQAKLWLRGLGEKGGKMASMLSTVSKGRNSSAHPTARRLIADLRDLVKASGEIGERSLVQTKDMSAADKVQKVAGAPLAQVKDPSAKAMAEPAGEAVVSGMRTDCTVRLETFDEKLAALASQVNERLEDLQRVQSERIEKFDETLAALAVQVNEDDEKRQQLEQKFGQPIQDLQHHGKAMDYDLMRQQKLVEAVTQEQQRLETMLDNSCTHLQDQFDAQHQQQHQQRRRQR